MFVDECNEPIYKIEDINVFDMGNRGHLIRQRKATDEDYKQPRVLNKAEAASGFPLAASGPAARCAAGKLKGVRYGQIYRMGSARGQGGDRF